MDYLGHVISVKGVATDPQKMECMRNWAVPTSVKALRGFLGLTENAFLWNSEAESAFNKLKRMMTSAPVLAMPDFSQPFVIETYTCGRGIGVVLMQGGRPITYLSKALAPKNLGLFTYKKEFLALLLALAEWKNYLQGNHFIIKR
ncbi:UNVERIFIED_CONTAM: Retrovirus-related Pol polyprotein from transposon.6 [Sesamum radiatum]|uniref:Retrovirus-related Pol polyprotein from transposon.6 n=1 Tax=Sesamum radiatum TaxID=300843 RepID=A0AAW2IVA1_SESRA